MQGGRRMELNEEQCMRVMVCITGQMSCQRLIQAGADLLKKGGGRMTVVHVAKHGTNFLGNPQEGDALDFLFACAKEHGADLHVLRSRDVMGTLCGFAQEHHITDMVMGASKQQGQQSVTGDLRIRLPKVRFEIIMT